MGEEGIAKRMNPKVVQAISELDDLEALDSSPSDEKAPLDEGHDKMKRPLEVDAERPSAGAADMADKRQKIDAPYHPLPPQPTGLLSAGALDSLKLTAALRQQQKQSTASSLAGLSGYGSDND